VPSNSRLTRARRLSIASALSASEHPDDLASADAVSTVWHEVRCAIRAARRIDPAGNGAAPLRAELERRLQRLADRLDELMTEDRRAVVAQVIALAAVGRAAGHPVRAVPGDRQRAPSLGGDLGALSG